MAKTSFKTIFNDDLTPIFGESKYRMSFCFGKTKYVLYQMAKGMHKHESILNGFVIFGTSRIFFHLSHSKFIKISSKVPTVVWKPNKLTSVSGFQLPLFNQLPFSSFSFLFQKWQNFRLPTSRFFVNVKIEIKKFLKN